MKATKITNVNFVKNLLVHQSKCHHISKTFMMLKRNITVTFAVDYFPQLDKLWCTLFRTNRVLARCQVTSGPRLNYFNFPRDGSADTSRYQQPSNGEIPTTNNLRSGRCQTGAIWAEISISYPTTAFYLHWTGDSYSQPSQHPGVIIAGWPARVGS